MKKELKTFLESDLLYKYIADETTYKENTEVEYFINNYPKAKKAYMKLQKSIELISEVNSKPAPKHLLSNIIEASSERAETKVIHIVQKNTFNWFSIAASFIAILFGIASITLYQQNIQLENENDVVTHEIYDLRSDIQDHNSRLKILSKELNRLNNPDAKRYVINGNDRAKDLKTVAYINPIAKTSMIDVVSLPQLPKEQHYEIWAELQDRMVNLGIIDEADRKLKPIPYLEDAIALSIKVSGTSEKFNLQDNLTEVAEVILNK